MKMHVYKDFLIIINFVDLLKQAVYFSDRSEVQCLHCWKKVLNSELIKGP
ncbi:hypothetical protein Hdeb2414_s0019g00551221 [Helianthus debilis subsp. tardiflorus]